ncbi:MAG: polysaccharide deacetylase family protein, partial [Chloroflexi bacterium]
MSDHQGLVRHHPAGGDGLRYAAGGGPGGGARAQERSGGVGDDDRRPPGGPAAPRPHGRGRTPEGRDVCLAAHRVQGDGRVLPSDAVLTAVLAAAAGTAVLAHGAFEPNSPVFGPVVGRGPRERVVYLTFDDGPNGRTTERIVNILERAGIPATFFMVGRHVVRAPALAHDVARAGFGIGNHTYTHTKLTLLGPRQTAEEISWAHGAIVG